MCVARVNINPRRCNATTGTVAGNALKSGAKTIAMERQEGSFRNGKGRAGWDTGRGAKGSVKMKEKEGGYSLGFKSRTRRTGLPHPRDASHFFRFLFAPGRILPFSPFLPVPLSLSPSPWSDPFWPPLGPSFLLPAKSSQVSEARAIRKSWASTGPDSRPPRCYPQEGGEGGKREEGLANGPILQMIRQDSFG